MLFTAATALFALAASSLALPQYDYSTTTTPGQVHHVKVGANSQLLFDPESIAANIGDTVIFQFVSKNHSVVQSSLAGPCTALPGGLDTGYKPVAAGTTDANFPTVTYSVTDSKPLWFYCSQGAGLHCHSGMVFAINCGANGAPNSFANFKQSAINGATAPSPTIAAPQPIDTSTIPGVTLLPDPAGAVVTSTVSVETSTWTTTYTSFPGSPDPTPSSLAGSVILVDVGANGQLAFSPPNVIAKPRDTVRFTFKSKNHTVTQSSFNDPCRKLQFTSTTGQIGFDSGFNPVAAGATAFPSFDVIVNDTAPIWVYCRQTIPAVHCGTGMVFAINSDESAGSTRSFSGFQSLAKQINGTGATGSSSSPSAATTGTSSASKLSTGFSLGLVGLAISLWL